MCSRVAQRSKTRITLRIVGPAPPGGLLSPQRQLPPNPLRGGQERAHRQVLHQGRPAARRRPRQSDYLVAVTAITRADVRDFIADQLKRWKKPPGVLQVVRRRGRTRGEPDGRHEATLIPDKPPPVLTDDQLRRLLKLCDGRDFTDGATPRSSRLFIDTGVRASEAAGIMLPDLPDDLDDQVVIVLGKGRHPPRRSVRPQDRPGHRPLASPPGQPLARRSAKPVGRAGTRNPSGLFQVVADRGASVGLPLWA
jgi:integrase